jgi:carbohydrate-selective porin OprB
MQVTDSQWSSVLTEAGPLLNRQRYETILGISTKRIDRTITRKFSRQQSSVNGRNQDPTDVAAREHGVRLHGFQGTY